MTKKHSTKKALMASALSLLLCFSMLVGTTFAWFTDSVTSTNNIITAGNLDIELYYQAEGQTDWTKVTDTTNVFKEDTLWEPGHTEVVKLKVVNEGTLALKYQLGVNVASEVGSVNVNDVEFKLSNFIKFGIVDGAQSYTRDQAIAAAEANGATELKTAYNSTITALDAKNDTDSDEKIVTMVVYMPTTVDNEANAKTGAAVPTINLGINVLATQTAAEADSFDNQYDAKAWTEVAEVPTPDANGVVNIYTAEQLAGVMTNTAGIKTINIKEDINLAGRKWVPAFVTAPDLVINGNGHIISNMITGGKNNVGFIGAAYQNITINELTFKNAKVEATGSFVGGIIGNAWDHANITFNNVDLIDSDVSTTIPNKAIRVGGLIGYSPYTRGDLTLKDCDVSGSTITGYHNVGAMVGTTMFYGPEQGTITVENCTAKNNTLKYGSPSVGAFAFGASTSGYTEYAPAGFIAENNKTVAVANVNADLQTLIKKGVTNIELSDDVTVDKWIMFSETKSISSGQIITVIMDGLTIDGNGHTLTVNSIESAKNGDNLFDDASNLNICDLTIKYADGVAGGGIGLKSGVISNVNFIGGGNIIYPGTGDIKVENCTFTNTGNALYFEQERDNLTVTGCTFNLPDNQNVILLRGDVKFTNNIVNSGRTVNIVSGSPVVTGNNFNNVRLKVYSAATATVSGNTINNLVFETATYASTFANNTLGAEAQDALNAVTKTN